MEKIPLSRLETVSLLEKIEYTSDFNVHSLLKYGKRADRYRFKNTKRVRSKGQWLLPTDQFHTDRAQIFLDAKIVLSLTVNLTFQFGSCYSEICGNIFWDSVKINTISY